MTKSITLPQMDPFLRLPADEIVGGDRRRWRSAASAIGASREGRTLTGLRVGRGSFGISLIAGCHADEPVGPALLDHLASYLATLSEDHELLRDFRWRVVPHVNPDGEARNRAWTSELIDIRDHLDRPDRGYDLGSYLRYAVRELPGEDIEFGFPKLGESSLERVRPENRGVADFLAEVSPIRLHGSFHGMGLAPGPWFLLEPGWTGRTVTLRADLTALVSKMGYRLFDAERHGEKGFHRIAPGFSTRPDSAAMREYFLGRGEPDQAARFRPSSMEFARAHGRDPMTFVSEMPLFLTLSLGPHPVERHQLQQIRNQLQEAAMGGEDSFAKVQNELRISPMPLRDQMRLQLALLDQALEAVLATDPSAYHSD